MRTSELTGPALDWAVAKITNPQWWEEGYMDGDPETALEMDDGTAYSPSTDWSRGGPIIQHEEIELHVIPAGRDPANWVGALDTDTWAANICVPDADYVRMFGPTPLIAAMRCFVASKLGDDININIPEGLCD